MSEISSIIPEALSIDSEEYALGYAALTFILSGLDSFDENGEKVCPEDFQILSSSRQDNLTTGKTNILVEAVSLHGNRLLGYSANPTIAEFEDILKQCVSTLKRVKALEEKKPAEQQIQAAIQLAFRENGAVIGVGLLSSELTTIDS